MCFCGVYVSDVVNAGSVVLSSIDGITTLGGGDPPTAGTMVDLQHYTLLLKSSFSVHTFFYV